MKFVKLDSEEAKNLQTLEEYEDSLFEEYTRKSFSDTATVEQLDDDSSDDEGDDVEEDQISCQPCVPQSNGGSKTKNNKESISSNAANRSNDADMKNFAFDLSLMRTQYCNPKTCNFGGNCVQSSTIEDTKTIRTDFWQSSECGAPSSAVRRVLILNILRESWNRNTEKFDFYAGCKKKDNRRVCEAGFLILLGLSNYPNASQAPKQWINLKKHISSGEDAAGITYSRGNSGLEKEIKCTKMNHALAFIQYFAKEFGDTIPGPQGI